jgi:teichuronic acid biosynthesis glycosyltransferase TuaG
MDKKQKYVFVGDGESVHLLKWVKEIRKYFDVFVISSQGFLVEIEELLPQDHLFSLQVNVQNKGLSLGYFSRISTVKKILKQLSPNIVNAHYMSSHGLLVVLGSLFSKPQYTFIASAWGTDVLVFPWKNKLFFYAMKLVVKKADWITSDSDYMTQVIQKIKPCKTLTFTFGLNSLPEYNDNNKDEHLYFSNRMLTQNYNIDRVLQVFSTIFREDNKARLLISHQGDELQKLKQLRDKLGLEKAVDFIGFIKEDEQIEIYTRACYYLSLPTSDSTSVSLLEALAYGCIPILSDIPANKEWVKDEDNGLIIQQDISYKKLQKLKDKRIQLAEKNREIISKKAIFPDLIRGFIQNISSLKFDSKKLTHSLVSVITPSYNSSKYVSETIESVIEQSYQNWEMIIVDDCSTDDSRKIIQQYCDKDSRITLVSLNENSGAAIARNTALKLAKGQYIAFLDSDDLWMPNKLEKQIAFMKEGNHPISFTAYQVFNETMEEHQYSINVPKSVDYKAYLKNTIIGMSTSIIDRAIIDYFEFYNIRTRQDTYLWITLLKKNFLAYGLNSPLMKYRLRNDSISANKMKAAQKVWFLYHHLEGIGFFKSLYYISFYGMNALKKRIK